MNDPFAMNSDAGEVEASGDAGNFFSQIPAILWQRRWWIIIPAVLGVIAAIAALVIIKPLYKSEAVMLVESQQLPTEVLALDNSELVDRRIARIKQQITARPDLLSLIDKHGLYIDERRSSSLSTVVSDMRDAITIIPSEIAGARKSDDNTIAFNLAFSYSNPVQAQAVAQDLMNQVLQLDSRGNAEQATNTVQFLTDQAKTLEAQITGIQGQISQVTSANGSSLAAGSIVGGGSANYDFQIAALLRNNQELIQQRSLAMNSSDRDPVVVAAEQQLAGARAVFAETHPDVILARQRLEEAKQLAAKNVSRLPFDAIEQQIAFNNSQIAGLRSAKANDESQMQQRMDAQSRAPLVQQQIGDLQQRLSAVNQQYEQVQARLIAAQAGVRAEDEQMAERLVVVEPPVVADEPYWPQRWMLAAGGIGGGLALGFVLAMAIEVFLQPLRDPMAVRRITGTDPIGVIPIMEIGPKKTTRRWRLPFRRHKTASRDA